MIFGALQQLIHKISSDLAPIGLYHYGVCIDVVHIDIAQSLVLDVLSLRMRGSVVFHVFLGLDVFLVMSDFLSGCSVRL